MKIFLLAILVLQYFASPVAIKKTLATAALLSTPVSGFIPPSSRHLSSTTFSNQISQNSDDLWPSLTTMDNKDDTPTTIDLKFIRAAALDSVVKCKDYIIARSVLDPLVFDVILNIFIHGLDYCVISTFR